MKKYKIFCASNDNAGKSHGAQRQRFETLTKRTVIAQAISEIYEKKPMIKLPLPFWLSRKKHSCFLLFPLPGGAYTPGAGRKQAKQTSNYDIRK
jgi:hypothetical protein